MHTPSSKIEEVMELKKELSIKRNIEKLVLKDVIE
jgi:hypothetical protein